MLLIILGVVEIAVLIVTIVSNLRSLIGPDPYAFFVLISANLALVIAWVGTKISLFDNSFHRRFDGIKAGLRDIANIRPGVAPLVDHEFYERFGKAIQDAKVGVAMTHLDLRPPNHNKKTPAAEYYNCLAKSIKSNRKANFRRVERGSPDKLDWIKSIINDYQGVANFSLGVLITKDTSRRTGLISVQLVDQSDVALVAIAEHDSSLGVRDIWITDGTAANLWHHYYEDILWRPSFKVIENGRLNETEWRQVTESVSPHE